MHRALSRQIRGVAGVAPTLHFPSTSKNADQVAINTAKALDMIRCQLGEKPEPYTRKYTATFAEVKDEIQTVLDSCGSDEAPMEDGKEVTQIQVIERVLRHGLCSYEKQLGTCSYADMEKWLVYTAADSMEFNRAKREAELKEKYEAYKQGSTAPCLPAINWEKEYTTATDREVVSEKRIRYDGIANTDFARDEAAIEAELAAYNKPQQDAALDQLIDQVKMFRPFLAKQVVQAKLIERNMDGQLTFARFADWNPDARDCAELHTDGFVKSYDDIESLMAYDEGMKRYADVRMKTKEEILETMANVQSARQSSGGGAASMGADEARRAQLLAEIVRLQSRAGAGDEKEDEKGMTKEEKEAAAEAARIENEKRMEKFRVSDEVVKSKGLLGLTFIDVAPVKEAASA